MTTPMQPTGWAAALQSMKGVVRVRTWGQWIMAAAMLTVLSLTPSVLHQQRHGRWSRDWVQACWPLWPILLVVMGALFGLLFRLSLDAAATFGLTALVAELLIRVVVLELVPFVLALVVLIRVTLPQCSRLRRRARQSTRPDQGWQQGLHIEALPRLLSSFLLMLLVTLSITWLLLAVLYVQLYGFNASGLTAFNRLLAAVWVPAMLLAWTVKLLLFAWSVSLLPMATLLVPAMSHEHNTDLQLHTLIRVMGLLLVIKLLSLMAAYA